jgi:hypothetical protein
MAMCYDTKWKYDKAEMCVVFIHRLVFLLSGGMKLDGDFFHDWSLQKLVKNGCEAVDT